MQSILGLDLSAQPCEITISNLNSGLVEVIERRLVDLPLIADLDSLLKPELAASFPSRNDDPDDESPSSDEALKSEEAKDGNDLQARASSAVEILRNALQEIGTPWSSVVVIMPPAKSLALNLNLPFGDPKNLNRIVDLEVQDIVPFDLDEFFVQYSTLGPVPADGAKSSAQTTIAQLDGRNTFDVHVGVVPRAFVKNVLTFCKSSGLEPNILTIPSSIVGAVFHLAKDYFKTNSAILLHRDSQFHLAIYINDEVRVEHTIDASYLNSEESANSQDSATAFRSVFIALRLAIASAERRYGSQVVTVYSIGKIPKSPLLEQLLGRPIEAFYLDDVIKTRDSNVGISALGPIFVAEDSPAPILSNFRTREFSFSPRFGEFLRAIGSVWRYIAGATAAVIATTILLYGLREYSIAQSKDDLIEQIQTVIPGFEAPNGDIRSGLLQAETKLSEDLGILGSPAKISPVDALVRTIQLIPEKADLTIQEIQINGTRVMLRGSAPNLRTGEEVQRKFKEAKDLFNKVNPVSNSPAGQRYNFTIEAFLSQ